MKHFTYGGSTAARTSSCAAWVQLSEGIPNIESEAARNGTCVHYLLEQSNLDDDFQIQEQLGKNCPETGIMITQDLVELAVDMWHADQALCERYNIICWEAESTGQYSEEIGSTLDKIFTGHSPAGKPVTVVIDYKSGRGKQVEAVSNDQLLHNCACLMHNSEAADLFDDAEMIIGVIIQPDRAGNINVKEWGFTKEMVAHYFENHLIAIDKTKQPGVSANAGDHCSFCPAMPTCPAHTGDAHRALLRNAENLEMLAENMKLVEQLKPWITAVEKAVYEGLELGSEIDGWKLVAKAAREGWIDEDEALKRLRLKAGGKRHICVDKLMTPAQVRKVLKARSVEIDFIDAGLTEKRSSGTTIAKSTDKREAVLSAKAFGAALKSVGG